VLRSLRLTLVLAALAVGGGLAFAAAATQAAVAPPLAAKAAGPSASAAAAPPAADGGTAIDAGTNIGNIVKAWGAALLLGVAGLMGLAALARRNIGEGLTLLAIVVIVGGFVFAPEQVKAFIRSLWQPISGG
jgi:hypothetical protein